MAGPASTLQFSRYYNSKTIDNSIPGFGWTFSWNDRLSFENSLGLAIYNQFDGQIVHFASQGNNTWINEIGKKTVLTETENGYTLTKPDNTRLFFNSDGRLIEKRDRNNNSITLSYDGDFLRTISDGFGRSLILQYNADSLLATLSSPIGTFTYGYDSKKNLTSVTKPDGGVIRYLYEDTNDIHNLTGVIDENNVRTQTIGYDIMDRVISSSLTNGSEAITIAYQSNYKRVITNSLGVATTYQLEAFQGVARVSSMTGPGCSSCGSTSDTKYLYDNRMQITEATDASGVKTTYVYDEIGNTTSVTKAVGTPLTSITTKTYDPVTNQVATITKPSVANSGQNAVTTMTYDANGNMISRQQSGYSGTTAISATILYTYNTYGQITSIDGPRTDASDVVNFSYYPNDSSQGNNRGNLQTVTDALGHATIYSNYNAFGQAETITDPNGIVTTRAYNGSGLLVSTTTAGLTTSYAYNSAGQMQTITQPGNRVISYSYSPADQIARITDSLGNAISYSYDSEGRRIEEDVHDPQNALTRYTGYGYDNYGHLNMVTLPGSAQETSE
ncbi:MAG: RHS repeat protein, partial [Planctomycetes bacterium]|nr:RHS repeat protein [Planctomycetota bacterium]